MLDRSARNAKIQEVADKMENKKIVKILMDVTKTLARQDIAFRGDGKEETNGNYNQIVMLVARHCPLLEKWLGSRSRKSRSHNVTYMSPESQNEMIQLLGQEVRNKILDEIKSAGMFAVSADTTPDASHKDQMTVVCRIAGVDGKPKERLLAMKVVTSKTGDATAKDVLEVINSNSLNTDELLFQSYDFASSMSGRFNGAQQKLQERLGQVVPYIPCQAHRSNTVVEHSCNASSIVKNMFNILSELYVFFTSSTKRFVTLSNYETMINFFKYFQQTFLDDIKFEQF